MERYKPTDLELLINSHYQRHGIVSPSDMCIERIAASFDVEVAYYHGRSIAEWQDGHDGYRLILLDKRLPEPDLRAEFFHELTHPLRHCGRQDDLPDAFVELQEIQAGQFQLAAALPVFMLHDFPGVPAENYGKAVAEEFRLPLTLVMRRLEQIHNRIIDGEMLKRTRRFRVPHGIDVTKPHVLQAIQDLRAIQRKKNGVI